MKDTNIYQPFVYLLVWPNGKMYVGSRTAKGKANPAELWKNYFTSSKYVKEYRLTQAEPVQFVVFPFEDGKEAVEAEANMLKKLNVVGSPIFLNRHNGDGKFSNTGVSPSEKTRQKLATKTTGRKHTEEARFKMRVAKKGKPGNRKGKHNSAEHNRKVSEKRRGKPGNRKGSRHSEESKQKIGKAGKGRTPWNKGKPSPNKGKPGKPHTEETKQKISEARKGKPIPANKGKKRSEESKQKMSEARKLYHLKQKLWIQWFSECPKTGINIQKQRTVIWMES